MALLHTVGEPQGVALQKRSLLSCPMFGSSLVNRSLGKDKDRPFDEHFPYLLELADHGLFDAKQLLFIVITISQGAATGAFREINWYSVVVGLRV